MGTLFKAAIGFGIAFYVWSPVSFAAHFETPTVANLRAQIETAHPHERLLAELHAETLSRHPSRWTAQIRR
jgi:hypothetical protein